MNGSAQEKKSQERRKQRNKPKKKMEINIKNVKKKRMSI